MYLRLLSSDRAWFAFPFPVTACDRVRSVLGLALAPLRGSSFQTPPIFSSIRSADDPQANPTIDDPRASRLSFPAIIAVQSYFHPITISSIQAAILKVVIQSHPVYKSTRVDPIQS
ncbi:hypothetical protein PGTUg99_037458 [Puccinia graminis f. sp. tritici]|uniref:Uncharacterized protein n=1 Tax=Puccinia graminis f. sp. tritici TaxID=56615 RepID=A0A5B0S1K9_PUCGR|nr:hypothetical protein PGTUg99_037458 [Puccinia graminis f. sp. tritici]